MAFSDKLSELLKQRGMKPVDLARATGLSEAIISMYLSGKKEPRGKTCYLLSHALNVSADELLETGFSPDAPPTLKKSPSLTPTAQRIGRAYESAPGTVRKIVEVALEPYMDAAPVRPAADSELASELAPEVRRRALPLHILPASAGGGEFLDSNDFELVNVGPNVPMTAHFGVRISGVSMEPQYPDGHIAWVRRAQSVEAGQVGVFTLNGDGYIKQMGTGELISLNPDCANIPLGEFDELRAFGVVVGVTAG